MVDARRGRGRAVHDHARQHGRERGAAVDPAGPRHQHLGARVGRERLRPHVRRAASHRREARRHARAAGDLHRRPRCLHRRVTVVRPRGRRGLAHRCAHGAGCRRRADESRDAVDHHRDLPAAAARNRDRHLGRRLRACARDRPDRGRPADGEGQLELDLLHQHSRRRARRDRGAALHRRDEGHVEGAETRLTRPDHLGGRSLRPHLRSDRDERSRLDVDARSRACSLSQWWR